MPASADFNGSSQWLTLIDAVNGPHKNLSYPFSVLSISRRVADVNTGATLGLGASTTGLPAVSCRHTSAEVPRGAIADNISFTNVTGTTDTTNIWGLLCFVVTSATDYDIFWNYVNEAGGTTSRDVLAFVATMNATVIGNSATPASGHHGQIFFVGAYNRALTASEQKEIARNPWLFSKNQVCKYFLLNTISAAGDCKDQGPGKYNMTGGTVPSASSLCPPVFMDGGIPY